MDDTEKLKLKLEWKMEVYAQMMKKGMYMTAASLQMDLMEVCELDDPEYNSLWGIYRVGTDKNGVGGRKIGTKATGKTMDFGKDKWTRNG